MSSDSFGDSEEEVHNFSGPDLATIRSFVGDDRTMAMLGQFAGMRISIPKTPRGLLPSTNEGQSHFVRIFEMLGMEFANYLIENFGGEKWSVPIAREFRVENLRNRGHPINEIARQTGISYSAVCSILRYRKHRQRIIEKVSKWRREEMALSSGCSNDQ